LAPRRRGFSPVANINTVALPRCLSIAPWLQPGDKTSERGRPAVSTAFPPPARTKREKPGIFNRIRRR
jgi:hypothetical protein